MAENVTIQRAGAKLFSGRKFAPLQDEPRLDWFRRML
jgi:hypothetical protein